MTEILFAVYKCNLCNKLEFVAFPTNRVLKRHILQREYDRPPMDVKPEIIVAEPIPRIIQHQCIEGCVIGIAEYVGYSMKELDLT